MDYLTAANATLFANGSNVTKKRVRLDYRFDQVAGASPLFPPKHKTAAEAKTAILCVVRRDPCQFGHAQSRWTLQAIYQTCDWLDLTTEGGLSRLLKRLGIRYKRGREYIHSPDPDYAAKVNHLTLCQMRAFYEPEKYVFLYLDEFSYYRQPTVARAYEAQGHHQALACRSHHSNTRCRGIGALNFMTGQLLYEQRSRITVPFLSTFYVMIRAAYPDAEIIYVLQDNWPVHAHPNVLARLQPQESPFWPPTPPNWPTEPTDKAVHDNLPIQLLFLPTYAPWLNPIEQLWRWLYQDVLHLHRQSDEWPELKQRVLDFMNQFAHGSTDLLHYVGLFPD